MDLIQLLELRLRARVIARYGMVDSRRMEQELQQQREGAVEALVWLLDRFQGSHRPAPPPPPPTSGEEPEVPVPGVKAEPTPEILEKALKLQTLAIQSPEEHERAAAWAQFEKLWLKYHLPTNLGM